MAAIWPFQLVWCQIFVHGYNLDWHLGSLSKHNVNNSKNVIWKCNFAFYFSITQGHYACKLCSHYPGIKLEPVFQIYIRRQHWTFVIICSHKLSTQLQNNSFDIVERTRTSAKMFKNEKCSCKACETIVFHCQICKFVTFSLPMSSWLLKLPIHFLWHSNDSNSSVLDWYFYIADNMKLFSVTPSLSGTTECFFQWQQKPQITPWWTCPS